MIDFIQNQLPTILYITFCVFSVLFGLGVIFLKNPVSAAFSLILVFLNVAGIFALQHAFFIAAVQVLVYAGAIMVLFIFVIMLLSVEHVEKDWPKKQAYLPIPIALSVALAGVFIYAILNTNFHITKGPYSVERIEELGGNITVLSQHMFSLYAVPFLAVGMLLSIAVVGAVVLAKRKVE
ncbi:MAG: NADH-quinone oxidoreductase subunit J [Oligoflexia bacterium]|nr:NADH-quinone oxidoreductase subunit J [Oligoflexia bacterium]